MTGGGKSAIGCYWILKSALKYNGTRWLIARNVLKDLKDTTLNTFWDVCAMQGITTAMYNYNETSGRITFANKSEIYLRELFHKPSDPNFDKLGSLEVTGSFVDEANQIASKAKDAVVSRTRYKLNEYGLMRKNLFTCNPAKNWVYNDFYKPNKEGTLADNMQFIQALVKDNLDNTADDYIKTLESIKDRAMRERLLYGNWDYDSNPARLMEYDSCTDLFTNDFLAGGDKHITADIARFGKDKTVVVYWDGYRVEKIRELKTSSIVESANLIREVANMYGVPMSRTIVDEDGIGGGVKDILECKGFIANTRSKQNYTNLKAECYYMLSDMVNKGQIYINSEKQELIVQELQAIERGNLDKDTKLTINSKDKQKEILNRSPDYADALMMRMYFDCNKMSIHGFAGI